MPVLAAATLELNADSAKLEQDLGRAVQHATTFGTAIGTVLGNAITSGVSKLQQMVSQAIDTGDELNKLSQKTGMSVENLSELRVAAELADVSMGTLKSGVKGLYQAISEAGRGSGKKNSAFEAIGLDIEKLRDLKPDEMFRVVTERLAKYEDGANRAAIQTAILGKSGAELSPFINELGKSMTLARQLGLTMSKETAEASERFKDNMTIGRLASEAMGQRIAQVLLPTLEKLSEFLVDNARNTDRLDTVARAADTGLKILATGAAVAGAAFEIVGGQIGRMAAVFTAVVRGDFKGAAVLAIDSVQDVGTALGEAAGKIHNVWEETGNKVHANAEKNGAKLAAPALAATEKIKKARKEADAEFAAFLKIRAIEDEAAAATQDFYKNKGKAIEEVTAKVEEQKKFLEETMAQIRYNQAHGGASGVVFDEDTAGFEKVAKQVEKTDSWAKEMGLTFTSAFEAAISGGQKLSAVLRGIEKDLLAIATRKLVTEPMGEWFTDNIKKLGKGVGPGGGGLSDFFSNLVSGGGANNGFAAAAGVAGGADAWFANGGIMTSSGPMALRRYSKGGIANSPQLAMFGEGDSNEAYVPLPDGRRIPVALTGGGNGSQSIHVEMHVHGVRDTQGFRESRGQVANGFAIALQRARRDQ